MRRPLILCVAVLLAGACDDGPTVLSPEVQPPAANLAADACAGLDGAMYDDCVALVALYSSTNGPGWKEKGNWLVAGQHHCDWHGITCSTDALPRVIEVRLFWNNLSGPFPAPITDLSALRVLGLGGNDLTGPIPDLSRLGSLLQLYLYANGLTGPVPANLDHIVGLEYIDLGGNELGGTIPASLGNVGNLVTLNLGGNNLTGTVPSQLNGLSKLRVLLLENNQLTGPLPQLTGLTSLQNFYLNGNNIGGSIPTWFTSLPNLKALSMVNTGVTGPIPPELGSITTLELLAFSENTLGGSIPAELGDLKNLYSLLLTNAGLTGAIPPELGGMANLGSLLISGNDLTGPIPEELGNLTNLVSFWGFNNRLSGEIPASLGNLTKLTGLNLENNQLSGAIPGTLGNLSSVIWLDLSHNQLTGPVPPGLANLYTAPLTLQRLDLQVNQLSGALPFEVAMLGVALPTNGCKMAANPDLYLPASPDYLNLTNPPGQPICGLQFQNAPPVADAGPDVLAAEGAPVSLDASASSDPDGGSLTYEWDTGDGTVLPAGSQAAVTHQYLDDGAYTATVTVSDGIGMDTDETSVTVYNVTPVITTTATVLEPMPVGQMIDVSAGFTDPGVLDTHTATIHWGDGETTGGTVTFSSATGEGTVTGSHAFASAGLYTVEVFVEDDDHGTGRGIVLFVVVYDPAGGFVTGAGWIDSPPGAYALNLSASGQATFRFVSKYTQGTQVPTGSTSFRFNAADLDFKSESVEWLVVNQGGTNAQFKGRGTVNGKLAPSGDYYDFMVWASDGDPDTFRIDISWLEAGGAVKRILYNNGMHQVIGAGEIKVHK